MKSNLTSALILGLSVLSVAACRSNASSSQTADVVIPTGSRITCQGDLGLSTDGHVVGNTVAKVIANYPNGENYLEITSESGYLDLREDLFANEARDFVNWGSRLLDIGNGHSLRVTFYRSEIGRQMVVSGFFSGENRWLVCRGTTY